MPLRIFKIPSRHENGSSSFVICILSLPTFRWYPSTTGQFVELFFYFAMSNSLSFTLSHPSPQTGDVCVICAGNIRWESFLGLWIGLVSKRRYRYKLITHHATLNHNISTRSARQTVWSQANGSLMLLRFLSLCSWLDTYSSDRDGKTSRTGW